MIKLSRPQIEAIASRLRVTLLTPIKAHNQTIYDSDEYINFYDTNPDCIAIKQTCEKYFDNVSTDYHVANILSEIRSKAFSGKFKSLTSVPDISTIIDDIIIETIDAESLDMLMKKLSAKWKNV